MILTITLIILLIIIIYINKDIREKYINSNNSYKKIDNSFYDKIHDVTEPKYNKTLEFNSNGSKINVKLESNDYSVNRKDNEINIKNTINPKKNIKYNNIFYKKRLYEDEGLKRLYEKHKKEYINRSNFF